METLFELEEEVVPDPWQSEETRALDFAEMETSRAEQSGKHENVGDLRMSDNGEHNLEAEQRGLTNGGSGGCSSDRVGNGGIHGCSNEITGNCPSSGDGESKKHKAADANMMFFIQKINSDVMEEVMRLNEKSEGEDEDEEATYTERMITRSESESWVSGLEIDATELQLQETETRPTKVQKIKDPEENKNVEKLMEEMNEKMQISEMASLEDQNQVMIIRTNEEERASLQQLRTKVVSLGVDLSLLVAQLLFLVSDDELAIELIRSIDLQSHKIDSNGPVVSRCIDVLDTTLKKMRMQKKGQKDGQKWLLSRKQIDEFMVSFFERVQRLEDVFSCLNQSGLTQRVLSNLNVAVENSREDKRDFEKEINDLKLQIFGNECETNGFVGEEMKGEMVEMWKTLFGREERKRGRGSPRREG